MIQQFPIQFSYPVIFTQAMFLSDNPDKEKIRGLFESADNQLCICIDDGLKPYWSDIQQTLRAWFGQFPTQFPLINFEWVCGGEKIKQGLDGVLKIVDRFAALKLCRHSYILAMGGGAVLDVVGFAAAMIHRGIRLIRIPTTVLSQLDSGVGIKNGINWSGQKNYLGTFAPPHAVIIDYDFLKTLPKREIISGLSESFKVAIIKDIGLFHYLHENAEEIFSIDQKTLQEIVYRTALIHLDHIADSQDPFEQGSAHPLDFGHWAAHQLESISGHTISHGEAVAVGIAIDCCYAQIKQFITMGERDKILSAMNRCGLVLWHPIIDRSNEEKLLAGLSRFREHMGGKLSLSMPRSIGGMFEIHEVDEMAIRSSIEYLRNRFAQ
jgi:3-dehydroquinate synthase